MKTTIYRLLAFCLLTQITMVYAQKKVEPAKAAVTDAAAVKPADTTVAKPTAVAEFKPLGFVGFAYAEGTYAITCGGPKFGFTYGAFGMAAGFYPSLVYSDANRVGATLTGTPGTLTDPIRPTLGAGIEISYGKLALIAPVYYLGGANRTAYYYTIGVGYKF